MVEERTNISKDTTRRSLLAAAGVGSATALAGCIGGQSSGGGGNQNLETLSDINENTSVSPTPSGSGTAPALERALDHATDGYDRVSTSYSEQGNAINENQLDVGVGTLMNFSITPSWLQQTASTVDNLRVLDVSDETEQAWNDDDRLLIQPAETGQIENVDAPEEVPTPTFAYNFVSRADLEYDTVYTFLETLYEQKSELAEYAGLLATHEEDDFWVENMYDGVPFHDAAADFYEEIGVWSDEFERAGGSTSGGATGDTDVRMRTSTSTTTAYTANQGMASAVNNATSDIFVEAQTSEGTEANLGALDQEDAEMVYIQNWSAQEVQDGAGSYSELGFDMAQIVHFYDLPWFFIAAGGN
ncbi:TAXI family TRAP transporter solute-binding subunit [Natrinema versiforme]|uniref:TRAP transporter solute receptor, TAXI family protein n=1 Tax=Natrinema versiforme JCM 10478 TaxID=1227496 RepID=L9XTB0_9EURY|nr:TAXI family TRAP transporter solute-binding subunit [Natrinema versiforme]ELY64995.1 TRAP transporter solute receptor, TAXI family protein [Natrinema versiforme JCM 10478]